jgi:hypothetical protein
MQYVQQNMPSDPVTAVTPWGHEPATMSDEFRRTRQVFWDCDVRRRG